MTWRRLTMAGIAFPILLAMLILEPERINILTVGGALFLAAVLLFILVKWLRYRAALKVRTRAIAAVRSDSDFYGVRFERTSGVCRVVGPFGKPEQAASRREPVAVEVPLGRVRLEEQEYRGIPWSDVYDEEDGDDSVLVKLFVDGADARPLQGPFDVLEGLTVSYAGAVGIAEKGVAERRRAIRAVLGGPPATP